MCQYVLADTLMYALVPSKAVEVVHLNRPPTNGSDPKASLEDGEKLIAFCHGTCKRLV